MGSPWKSRLIGVGLLALAAIVMFELPSAYAIARGAPGWLALAIGLLVFPMLPVTWHIVRQRQRRAAPASAKPSNTTGWERFAFRQIVVGVVVIGALLVLDRSRVWRGVRHHALWMIPTTIGPLDPESKLLDLVPASAETIIWLRDTDDAQAMVSQLAPTSFGSRELVISLDGSQAMVLETGDGGLIELIEPLYKRFATGGDAANVEKLPGGIRRWSTGGWKPSTGRATALIDLMRRAPETAFIVAAARPRSVKADEITSAVGWISADRGELEAIAEVTATTPLAAVKLLAEAQRSIAKERAAKPAEFACGTASDGSLGFAAFGSIVVARARIPVDAIRPLFVCLDRD